MTIFAVFLICFAVKITYEVEMTCMNLVTCPCGNKGYNVSVCVSDGTVYTEVCTRLANCESCKEGSNICSKCPQGFEGPFCTHEKSKIRQKRQFSLPERRPIRRRQWNTSTQDPRSCSMLDASNLGSIECTRVSSGEEICTGKCWTDYHFTLTDFVDEMNLTCRRGIWTPHDSFPECIRTPDTDLIFCPDPGYNAMSFRRSMMPPNRRGFPAGTQLVYSCEQGYEMNGGRTLFCLLSGEWSASRPRCVSQTSPLRTSDTVMTHCQDPGITANSFRRPSTLPTTLGFIQGSQLEYSCEQDYNLSGERRLICLASGKWTGSLPSCVMNSTTPGTDACFGKEVDGKDGKEACQNWGGGNKCMHFACPPNYLRSKVFRNLCNSNIQECPSKDLECLNEAKEIIYKCTTLNSNRTIPESGHADVYYFRDLSSNGVKHVFDWQLKDVKAPIGVTPATKDNFQLRKDEDNKYQFGLIKSLQGPQEIEINIIQKMVGNGTVRVNKINKLFFFVSEF